MKTAIPKPSKQSIIREARDYVMIAIGTLYPPVPVVTAEMVGFSMIGGTMPRMSKKRKLELSFFLNDRDRKSTRLNSSHGSESRMPSSA